MLCAQSGLLKSSGRGGFELVSLRRCSPNNIVARYLLLQT